MDLVAELAGWQVLALICRMLLMPSAGRLCWTGRARRTRLVILVVIALGFSWLGDFLGTPCCSRSASSWSPRSSTSWRSGRYWRRSLLSRPRAADRVRDPRMIAVIGLVASRPVRCALPVAVYGASLA